MMSLVLVITLYYDVFKKVLDAFGALSGSGFKKKG